MAVSAVRMGSAEALAAASAASMATSGSAAACGAGSADISGSRGGRISSKSMIGVKVRELFLKKKAWELDREVDRMIRQNEAGRHVRMLTQEIRKSLDRHTILYATLVELSNTLGLQNCAIWMPNEIRTEMNLTHELIGRSSRPTVPINDPDIREIKDYKEVKILMPGSSLGLARSGGSGEPGAVAAIRMLMLRVSNFKEEHLS
ncbi:PREDICTED: ethylene receptor 2-like [Nelumbo nucifera]|uniref:Ethylene receptor 2-like n=1 Tax=Nelumbo nucifera TaxID=4432 RepID=A0A1U7Z1R5_NELNU|nr:PREDICTED: ethylene receptor 2-like [Nelumbo nucifera]